MLRSIQGRRDLEIRGCVCGTWDAVNKRCVWSETSCGLRQFGDSHICAVFLSPRRVVPGRLEGRCCDACLDLALSQYGTFGTFRSDKLVSAPIRRIRMPFAPPFLQHLARNCSNVCRSVTRFHTAAQLQLQKKPEILFSSLVVADRHLV